MHVAGIRNSLNSVSLSHVRASAHAEAGRGRQGQPAAPMHLDVPFSLSSVGSALLPKLCFFSLNAVASRVWGFSGVGTSWRGCKVRRRCMRSGVVANPRGVCMNAGRPKMS
eukprot:scaffold82022_cov19-Tisochrysis_lutea.AAC.1